MVNSFAVSCFYLHSLITANYKQYTVLISFSSTWLQNVNAGRRVQYITVFIHIKAGLKYTQGLKYTPGSAAEWKK